MVDGKRSYYSGGILKNIIHIGKNASSSTIAHELFHKLDEGHKISKTLTERIVYKDIAVGAEEDASVTTTAAVSGSNPAALPAGVETVPLSTLELNHWLLGGDREIKKSQPVGFWSTQLSGEDGVFASPPTITIVFDQKYTSLGVSLRFGASTGDYCSDVKISWYQGTTLLTEASFQPDGPEYYCENKAEAYNKIIIQLNRTSLPVKRARLTRIMFGITRTFLRDELRSVNVTQQVDLISMEAAVNTTDFQLDSKHDIEYMFQLRQPLSIRPTWRRWPSPFIVITCAGTGSGSRSSWRANVPGTIFLPRPLGVHWWTGISSPWESP